MQPVRSAADFASAFGVSRETLQRLEVYAELLQTWQRAINLVSPNTLPMLWHRHFADFAQLLALVPTKRPINWVDLGSGAGFPGLVAAIMLAEMGGGRITMIESDAKKCAFLREVARKVAISDLVAVDIVMERIETAAVSSKVGPVDVVSARALASLTALFELSAGFFGPETWGLFPKGRDCQREVDAAQEKWAFSCDLVPSLTEAGAAVAVVKSLRRRVSG